MKGLEAEILRLLRLQGTPPTPRGPPLAPPTSRRHFREVVPALLPGPADGTAPPSAETPSSACTAGLGVGWSSWPLTQNRDARDGRGSSRRASPRPRAQAERGHSDPRPREPESAPSISALHPPGERCAGGHLAPGAWRAAGPGAPQMRCARGARMPRGPGRLHALRSRASLDPAPRPEAEHAPRHLHPG